VGSRAIFALPLRGRHQGRGSDLYRDVAGKLTDAEWAEALSFADATTEVLMALQVRCLFRGASRRPCYRARPPKQLAELRFKCVPECGRAHRCSSTYASPDGVHINHGGYVIVLATYGLG
jgi:hypothetical protein